MKRLATLLAKLKKRYLKAKNHPVATHAPLLAMFRYAYFNLFYKNNALTFKWIGQLTLPIRKGDAAIVGNYYYKLADFNDSLFVLHVLKQGDCFIDVGANLGHFSLLASGLRKVTSYCYEPVPSTYQQLLKIRDQNNLEPLINTKNMGVSDSIGKLWFSSDKNNMNRVVHEHHPGAVCVNVTKLDQEFTAINSPTMLKIDVEGYEKFVLNGARHVLKNKKLFALIIELNSSGEAYESDEIEIIEFIKSFGFKPFAYDAVNRTLSNLETKNTTTFNTIFIKDEEFVKTRIKQSKPIKVGRTYF